MRTWITAIGLAAVVGSGLAQEEEIYGPRPLRETQVRERDAAALAKYADDKDTLVLPGLVAHRKERRVEVLAESTGLAGGELIEYLLVDKASSHGYEALLWSYAKPSDVHRALEFIGLKPGKPFNPHVLRFWSDGDRVHLSITPEEGGALVPIEQLVSDTDTQQTMPEEGFVFAGSIKVPAPDQSGTEAYAADIYDPRSVASIYSEPSAVLDMPRQVLKEEAYGKQVVNAETAMKHGTLLTLAIEPMDAAGTATTRPTNVTLAMDTDATGSNYTYRLTGDGGNVLNTSTTLVAVLEAVVGLRKQDVPAALTVTFAPALPISEVRKTCVPLMMLENMGSIQVEPPSTGHLYYRAYVPDTAWAKPEGRPSQPWELRLTRQPEGGVSGKLVLNESVWADGALTPTYTQRQIDAPTPEAMRLALAEDAKARQEAGKSALPSALLVFTQPSLTYGQLHDFIAPVIGAYGTVHVFVE